MKKTENRKAVSSEERDELLQTLQVRFEKYRNRHQGLDWSDIRAKLTTFPDKMWSLAAMERTGGEPDVVGRDDTAGEYLFMDCSPESPKGRTAVCYDREGLESRKEHQPKTTAMDLANEMGIELLTEDQYRELQKFGEFDRKTSSWVRTPEEIRKLGGALFGDRRFGRVFIYHNGAQSYYRARAFRGVLRV